MMGYICCSECHHDLVGNEAIEGTLGYAIKDMIERYKCTYWNPREE
jgi:hypothetical protein